jgi:catechol-2,3-dioxygenase
MRITQLRLYTANVGLLRQFYVDLLGMVLIEETPSSIALQAGETRLIFERDEQGGGPFYHFAFNIPENQLAAAKDWLAQRGVALSQASPDDWHSTSWNAHAVYFYDPAGNIVECIARHTLRNAAAGAFAAAKIACVSEIGLVVDDVPEMVRALQAALDLPIYQDMQENFAPLGDEHGLFIVVRRGRTWLASNRRADVFPTAIKLLGERSLRYHAPQAPYSIEAAQA